MSIKVYINQRAIDGIKRVIEAQIEHLPKFGVEVTSNIDEADVICNHGTALEERRGVPSVHVGHGFMWSRQPWGDGYMEVNRDVVESMTHAVAHTAPSEWVARAIRRGGFWYPEVVYHGIDPQKFKPSADHKGYVLWNKARADYVSDPGDMLRAAELLPHLQFVTTIGSQNKAYSHPRNVKVIGALPFPRMKQVVADAGVYLATARETFGIGILEALASGVPVAGWDWGGQSEIIVNGITGYLAKPGDYAELESCIERCLAERERLSQNAIADVLNRWTWEPRVEQYANIFKRVYQNWNAPAPKVSVIVTTYKLDQFLPDCLGSVQKQTYPDFECIVVDDANLPSTRKIVESYGKSDKRFIYRNTPENLGLPGARNYGLEMSRGRYIRHLDADDFLALNALELETNALDANPGIHIVYGHLEVVRPDGSRVLSGTEPVRGGWPPKDFNWYHQMAHLNQLPSCVMARREVYDRSGGYRTRMKRNEDAEFWCRVTSLGFRAKKFTEAVTYFHRERPDSKGATEWAEQGAEPDWTAWFPWRMGASNFDQARDVLRERGESPRNEYLVPFGAQGKPPKKLLFWYIHDHAYPVVSIIVTCGPGHRKYLLDALDSIQGQTYPDWECIVVNDTGEEWGRNIVGAPWAKVVSTGGNRGASAARNKGFEYARGKLVVWMDADDYWLPWFLERLVLYSERNKGVVYSDMIVEEEEKFKVYGYRPDFDSTRVISDYQYSGSSVLVPREIAEAIIRLQGGWDEQVPGKEDWDYQIATHHLGFCAHHVREPLFVYRTYSTTKRVSDHAKMDEIIAYIDRKWAVYRSGEKQIMCGCNTLAPPAQIPQSLLSSSGNFTMESIQEAIDTNDGSLVVVIEYLGELTDPFTVSSRTVRMPGGDYLKYRFDQEKNKVKTIFLSDLTFFGSQLDAEGKPKYRVISNVARIDTNDPSAFVGAPITV